MSRDRAAYRAEYDPRRPEILEPDVPLSARYDKRPYGESPRIRVVSAVRARMLARRLLCRAGVRHPLWTRRSDTIIMLTLRLGVTGTWTMMGTTSPGQEPGTDRRPIVATASASSAIRTAPRPGSWDARQEREFRGAWTFDKLQTCDTY